MQQNLISLWHFDENSRHIAINAIQGRNPLFIHGAVHAPRRFGQALELRLPADRVTGQGPGRLLCGSLCFWVQVNGGRGQVELLNLQGMIQMTIDLSEGLTLIANVDDQVLASQKKLSNGQWHHIALTFNADGLKLYLDAQQVAGSEAFFAGLSVSSSHQNYLQIGPLPAGAGSVLIDELAIFNIDLLPVHLENLLQGVLEPTLPDQKIPEPGFVDATGFMDRNDPSCGFQKAIDSLGWAGGVVQLPMGRFVLRQTLKLTSRTFLKGTGFATMLLASPPVSSQLMISVKAGADHVQVDDSSLFEVGDDVTLATPSQLGWEATRVRITRIDGAILWFDGPMIADYDANAPTMVCHWYPLIDVLGQSQVHISDLHLMGSRSAIGDTPFGPDSACCAVQLVGVEQGRIERVFVEDWAHDGIGLYDSWHCHIQQCHIRNSLGHGIRVDEQSGSNWISQNQCHLNQGVGIYLSGQTQPCIISQNILNHNQKGNIEARNNSHHVKANLAPPPGSSGGTSGGIPRSLHGESGRPEVPTYTNGGRALTSDATGSLPEQSVSRRLRGLDAFD